MPIFQTRPVVHGDEATSEPAGEVPAEVTPVPSEVPTIEPTPVPAVRRRRHPMRWVWGVAGIIIVAGVAWFGIHGWIALHSILQKHKGTSVLDTDLGLAALKGEGNGRVNILVMGVGGAGHDGPNLTDTMMMWSIDPKTKDIAAISVPRDLYVKIPGYGYGKINSANADGGPQLAEKVVANVLGINPDYYVVVDFSGFKQAIDAVGGIDVNVATALYDRQYPCDVGNGICPYSQPAGLIHMTGAQALKYTRCRHNDPGVGNCGNDYGRSARQQQVVAALRAKALTAGTLTNPVKLTSLIDAVGSHVKTDLSLSNLKKLGQFASGIDTSKIVNKVLDDEPDNYLVGGTNIIPAAGYIYVPKAGNFDYSLIHDFVTNIFVNHYITEENARIEVQNGSGVTGVAGSLVASLTAAHYNMLPATNAVTNYPHTVVYDYTGGKKPYTIKYLEQRFGVTAQRMSLPSTSPTPSTSPSVGAPEIRIILGSDYRPTSSATTSQ